MKWVEKRFPATDEYDGAKLFTHVDGKKLATPMFIVIMALGTTDLLFALDSIPAIYGLTKEPYLVLTANLFALMGLRQLYFLIGGLLKKLVYLSLGLAVLLAFIGVKLVLHALHENELPFINGGEHVDCGPGHPDLGVPGRDRRHPRRHHRRQPLEVPQGRARAALSLLTGPGRALVGSLVAALAGAHHQGAGQHHEGHAHELQRGPGAGRGRRARPAPRRRARGSAGCRRPAG